MEDNTNNTPPAPPTTDTGVNLLTNPPPPSADDDVASGASNGANQTQSLLDDVNKAVNNTTQDTNADDTAQEDKDNAGEEPEIIINEETVGNYIKDSGFDFSKDISIGVDALGDGEQFVSAAMIKALTPAIMKLGIPANKAGDAYQLIAAYEKAQLEHNNKAAVAEINARAEASRKEFGKSLGEVCQLAEQGGSAIFGDGLWEEMKEVPILTNDKRFLRALAKVGRMLKTDRGTNASNVGAERSKSFTAEGWVKSSSRYQ